MRTLLLSVFIALVLAVALALAMFWLGFDEVDTKNDRATTDTAGGLTIASADCELVPAQLQQSLREAAKGRKLAKLRMVRSRDHAAIWFITAQVDDSYPATWASNVPKDGSGLIFSMDDNAFDITGFGPGDELREPYRLSRFDHGWLGSRECSEAAIE